MFVQVLIQHVQSKSLSANSFDLSIALGDIGNGFNLVFQMTTPITQHRISVIIHTKSLSLSRLTLGYGANEHPRC